MPLGKKSARTCRLPFLTDGSLCEKYMKANSTKFSGREISAIKLIDCSKGESFLNSPSILKLM